MNYLGIDIGSSFIKVALVNGDTLQAIGYSQTPSKELEIIAHRPGWAEQDPETWWQQLVSACGDLKSRFPDAFAGVGSIGIAYQMHGLVLTDENFKPLRPAIIWCDSRAVDIGNQAFNDLGNENCLSRFLNSPGNFTASRLKWVKDNEPSVYDRVHHALLPGDYIAARLTGLANTTYSGLSEGILWDFINNQPAHSLITYFDFREDLFPKAIPSFGNQGVLQNEAIRGLGLPPGVKVGYRAGDQVNNAFSLGVMEPGDMAADAGTSGVIYAIHGKPTSDPKSRVNGFAHVNHDADNFRLGVLACLNGSGIFYSWVRKLIGIDTLVPPSYEFLNGLASKVHPGSDHLRAYPFGNGAERLLGNQDPGGSFSGLNFNVHTPGHLLRAVQEGVVFSMNYGLEIMKEMGVESKTIRAGQANLFLSPLFRQIFADVTKTELQIFDSTGSLGAAIGGAIGLGKIHRSDWLATLKPISTQSPDLKRAAWYADLYHGWKTKMP